jgi:opine dehydrogenase
MDKHSITVVGAGNSGCALAAHLKLKGHKVKLLKTTQLMHEDNFDKITQLGGVNFSKDNREQFVTLDLITRDFERALDNTDIVIIATNTLAHEGLAPKVAPYLTDNQIVLFEPGYGGSLIFAKYTRGKKLIYAEATSLPIDSRIQKPGQVSVIYENVRNPLGFFPAEDSAHGFSILRDLYSNFTKLSDVLEAALHNPNLVLHTVGAIMSIGRIEYSKGEFWMCKEAFTPSVWRILHKLDSEKMSILARFDLRPTPYLDMARFRNSEDLNKYPKEVFDSYSQEGSPKGPFDSSTRYITEDVPMGLGLMHSLAKKVGVKTPICDALIEIASAINQTDYWQQARTLEALGLEQLSLEKINRFLLTGERA